MNTSPFLFQLLGICVVGSPAVLLMALGLTSLLKFPLSERAIARCTQTAVVTGLASVLGILVLMLISGSREVPIEMGDVVVIPDQHFHFHLKFVFDRLSVPFTVLSFVLVGTVGTFANRYLHRDAGYRRFFVFYAMFLLGIVFASVAGTIETLFLGWELVGLSSALLIAYFHDRPSPVRNGQRVWSMYRVADAAFLLAAVALHHTSGGGEFSELMGSGPWPLGQAALTSHQALLIGSLLLIAAAGKSGLIPFSGWLPRAMEGPTPSSAIFYGALSVHLGAYLLLRVSPILQLSYWLSGAVVLLGLATAVFAAVAARVQTDIKSVLAFASLTQVGIIVVEIGMGLRYLALIHIVGHACLRTLQLLRAPMLLRDYHALENALGSRLPHRTTAWERAVPLAVRQRLYAAAMERGGFDAALNESMVRPFIHVFRWCDAMERRWTDFLSRVPSRESDAVPPAETAEEWA